ncbi:hypothetical protein EVAR_28921_1 [Eumeta japonica]|uniref:Uncharacterized protein n=1 Tax=Eumeta variegata TaxID=151549 RepID=A0A4C1YMH9_EUMVA|nr:hypothetical protein EVAR_28921_1 [Eumeta japonica]
MEKIVKNTGKSKRFLYIKIRRYRLINLRRRSREALIVALVLIESKWGGVAHLSPLSPVLLAGAGASPAADSRGCNMFFDSVENAARLLTDVALLKGFPSSIPVEGVTKEAARGELHRKLGAGANKGGRGRGALCRPPRERRYCIVKYGSSALLDDLKVLSGAAGAGGGCPGHAAVSHRAAAPRRNRCPHFIILLICELHAVNVKMEYRR